MTEHSLWRFSRALHRAINERQLEEIAGLLDDEVEWAIYGPIDLFPFFGSRRGKAAVLEVIRQIADNLRVRRFDREQIMLGADVVDVALFADRARFEQADFVAGCAFRPVQGWPADQFSRAGRYVRPGRADGGLSDSSAADGGSAVTGSRSSASSCPEFFGYPRPVFTSPRRAWMAGQCRALSRDCPAMTETVAGRCASP